MGIKDVADLTHLVEISLGTMLYFKILQCQLVSLLYPLRLERFVRVSGSSFDEVNTGDWLRFLPWWLRFVLVNVCTAASAKVLLYVS